MRSQRAIQLFDGHTGLHEVGVTGGGTVVGLVDSGVTLPALRPFVQVDLTAPGRSQVPGHLGHGDQMATTIVQAAPDVRLAVANVFDRRGLVYREAIAWGVDTLRAAGLRIINVSLEIRRVSARCSSLAPCVACRSLTAASEAGLIVVSAVGNRGLSDGAITCPGAAEGVLRIASTVGPTGSSAVTGDEQPVSGTSVSAALVTGGCALLLSKFSDLTLAELRTALSATSTLLDAPSRAVGSGRAHFYRAYRYLEHVRGGGRVDAVAAEALVAPFAGRRLVADTAEARVAFQRAIALAPWGGSLHLALAILTEESDPAASRDAATESLRLDWSVARTHRLLSRLLRRAGDDFGADVEQEICLRLVANDELGAAEALFRGMANR